MAAIFKIEPNLSSSRSAPSQQHPTATPAKGASLVATFDRRRGREDVSGRRCRRGREDKWPSFPVGSVVRCKASGRSKEVAVGGEGMEVEGSWRSKGSHYHRPSSPAKRMTVEEHHHQMVASPLRPRSLFSHPQLKTLNSVSPLSLLNLSSVESVTQPFCFYRLQVGAS
ncbi:unnamed protein product [Lactuca saligna]|uniref:Uncharacterized protein n=1 Tax=Lactuca saligna TaxID=75948 RepID=A0AA35YMK2_LACSI|nr:unnamed protein product [Lactuca saligna]